MDKKIRAQKILTRLVGVNTTNPDGNELDIIGELLEILQLDKSLYTILHHGDNRASMIVDISGENEERVAFWGHLDTVPIGDGAAWHSDPFQVRMEGDVMYGRGTTDMKGGLTAMVILCQRALVQKPPVHLRFIFTADEECGGMGIMAVKEQGYLKDIDYVVIAEPSGLEIGLCEKGALWTKMKVTGKSCHAANPDFGVNALEHSFAVVEQIKDELNETFEAHSYLGRSSCSATMCRSGTAVNIIPESAEVYIDTRTVPVVKNANQVAENIIQEVSRRYCNQHKNLDISVETLQNRPTIQSATDNNLYRALKAIYPDDEAHKIGINFFTDGALGLWDLEIPFVILGPGAMTQCHTANEHININDVVSAADVYEKIIALVS